MASTASRAVIMPRSPWLASAGMDELRRSTGRGEGGGYLAPDMPALADARNDHPPPAICTRHRLNRLRKGEVDGTREGRKPLAFGLQHATGDRDVRGRLRTGGWERSSPRP